MSAGHRVRHRMENNMGSKQQKFFLDISVIIDEIKHMISLRGSNLILSKSWRDHFFPSFQVSLSILVELLRLGYVEQNVDTP